MPKRSFSVYIKQTIQTVQQGGKPLLQILLGGQLCMILISIICQQANPFNSNPDTHPFLYIIWALGTLVLSILMMVSCLFILKNAQEGFILTWKEALKRAAERFWPVLGASLVYLILLWVIFFLLAAVVLAVMVVIYTVSPATNILFGLIAAAATLWVGVTLLVGVLFSVYAVAVDQYKIWQALPRAVELMKTNYWGTFGLALGGGVIALAVSTLVGIIQLFVMPVYVLNPTLGILCTWVLSLPCGVINTTVLLGLAYELYSSTKRCQTQQMQTPLK